MRALHRGQRNWVDERLSKDTIMDAAISTIQSRVIADIDNQCRDFIREQINAYAYERHHNSVPIPKDAFKKSAALGLLSYKFPQELGGRGKDDLAWGLFLEELGYICDDNSFPMLLSYYTGVAEDIYKIGDQNLIEKYVCPMLRGNCLGAFAYSEDSDHFSFRSSAKRHGDMVIVKGVKRAHL